MDSQRVRFMIGLGASIVGTIISYALYKMITEKKSPKPDKPPERNLINDSVEGDEAEIQISPPSQFSSKPTTSVVENAPSQSAFDPNKEGEMENNSHMQSENLPITEEPIHSSSAINQASQPAVVVEEVVVSTSVAAVFASSDLTHEDTPNENDQPNAGSSFLNDSDITELNVLSDSDIIELVDQQCSYDSDIIEVAIVPKQEKTVVSEVVTEQPVVLNPSTSELYSTLNDVTDSSLTEMNTALEELEQSLGGGDLENGLVTKEAVEKREVDQLLNNSHPSDDSMNGCASFTTDSGIGLTSSSNVEKQLMAAAAPPLVTKTEKQNKVPAITIMTKVTNYFNILRHNLGYF